MEKVDDSSVFNSLVTLGQTLGDTVRYDIADHSILADRMFKKHSSLFCEPHPYIIGNAPEIKLAAQIYDYFPRTTYEQQFRRKFLSSFISRDKRA